MTWDGVKRRKSDRWYSKLHDRRRGLAYVLLVLVLAYFNYRDSQQRSDLVEERKRSVHEVCTAINEDRRILRGIVTQALEPEPGDSPDDLVRDQQLKAFALSELMDLDCIRVEEGESG